MSNTNHRELERKYEVLDLAYWECPGRIVDILGERGITRTLDCFTNDTYWQVGHSAQFVRLRDSSGVTGDGFSRQLVEITAKTKDRGNNWNRGEINTAVESAQDGYALLEMLAGKPRGQVRKTSEWVGWWADGAIISVSLVGGVPYLEVEAPEERQVQQYARKLEEKMKLRLEPRSFFEIFVQPEAT